MNKLRITTFFIWFTTISIFSHAQNVKSNAAYIEKIEVHTNTDFLITGETLYYSIHCLENGKNRFSNLSKLAYVELVGESEKPFLQTKVALIEGSGAGDFFLPSTLPSGNYTLIAYTKWMRNFPMENFFQKQITIINPYLKPFITSTQGQNDETISSNRSLNQKNFNLKSQVQLNSDKEKYSSRQKVVVGIKNNDPVHDCKISLSVHYHDKEIGATSELSKPDSVNNKSVSSVLQLETQKKEALITFLPDLRGETLSGIVKEGVSHQPIANTNIYLSARDHSNFFQISKTDSLGRFYFSSKNIQTQSGIQFQIEGAAGAPFEVTLDDEFVNDYKKFKPFPLSIDTTLRRQIEQRNVYSQIENAYYARKRDSVLEATQEPFFGKPDRVYNLDDFTRFPTMEDIFREYIFEVVVSKRDKKFILQVLSGRTSDRFSNTPLILVDGILVFDTEILMNYNPLLIKKISIVTKQYVYAGILFDGIVSVDTYDGNAKELPIVSIRKDYVSWQHNKKYYSPIYDANDGLGRIPDYRVQLFWNPVINIEAGQEFIVEFYTSDVAGFFLIEAMGFSSNGEQVNLRKSIEVRK